MNPLDLALPGHGAQGHISYDEITGEPHLHFPRNPSVNYGAERNRAVAEGVVSRSTMRRYVDAQWRANRQFLERTERMQRLNFAGRCRSASRELIDSGEYDRPPSSRPTPAVSPEHLPDGVDRLSVLIFVLFGWAIGFASFVLLAHYFPI